MRKVYVEIKSRIIINMDEGVDVAEVIDEMDYGFTSQIKGADIVDAEIMDYEVVDSK